MKTLEFESAFKELKLISFNAALENVKKSSELLLYEISLNISINEAKFCSEACLSVGNKILQQQEEAIRYFSNQPGGVKRRLCQMLEEDGEKIKEIEESHCIVDQDHRDVLSKLKEAREEDEERKIIERKVSRNIEVIEKIQKKINDSEGVMRSVENLYEEEEKRIRETQKKKIWMLKKILGRVRPFENFEKDIDVTKKIEEHQRLSKEKKKKDDDQMEHFRSLELKTGDFHPKKQDVLQNLKAMNEKLENIREEYSGAEQKSIEKYEKSQVSQKLQKQNISKSKVFLKKLEITLMENEDIKSQLTSSSKLSKNSLERSENYQMHIVCFT